VSAWLILTTKIKKMEKYLRRGTSLIWLAFILNILETWFFGWNSEPASVAEKYADTFCALVMISGVMYYLFPILIALRTCTKAMDQVAKQQFERDERT
jgi:hypothetical protein